MILIALDQAAEITVVAFVEAVVNHGCTCRAALAYGGSPAELVVQMRIRKLTKSIHPSPIDA